MFKFNLQPLLLSHAGHVHQARAVGTCDVFGACLYVALHLVEAHLCADGSLLHGEHTTEAAALVRTLRLYHLYALHKLEQVLDFVELLDVLFAGRRETQLTYTVTGVVQAHLVGERAEGVVNLHHVVQELHHVHGFLGCLTLSLALQQSWVVDADECRTTYRRCHHIVEALELLLEFCCQ